MDDGGYYAIKGFSFQFIKSLYEIFNSNNEKKEFTLENEQDFNTDICVYQIKYKETQEYTGSKIKEAVINILEEFKVNKKNYILYAHFKDKYNEQLIFNSIEELDKILLNCKIDKKQYVFENSLKEEFIKHFTVSFSKTYEQEVENLIGVIAKKTNSNEEVARIYYAQLVEYIIKTICSNKKRNRKTTLFDLLCFIKSSSNIIFYDYFCKYQSKDKYIKFIKKQYFYEQNINHYERIFIIDFDNLTESDLFDIIVEIKNRFFRTNNKKTLLVSPPPYIYINDINKELLLRVKQKLYSNKILFNDGYPYHNSGFDVNYITKDNSLKTGKSIKVINYKNELEQIIGEISSIKKIYRFYSNKSFKINFDYYNIKLEEIRDIEKIIK